jgi:hypothetical protein
MAYSLPRPAPIGGNRVAPSFLLAEPGERRAALNRRAQGLAASGTEPGAEWRDSTRNACRAVRPDVHLCEFPDTSEGAHAGSLYAARSGFYAGRMQTAGAGSAHVACGMSWGRRCAGAVLFLTALLGAKDARADAYDDTLREGVAARDRARESDNTADWKHALTLFARAVAERDTLEARFELAEAASELGQNAVAFESYELSLDRGLSGKAAEIASAFMAAHEDEVARLELVGPAGSIVFVNGQRRAELPLARPLVVPAGRVRLGLVAPRATPWEQAVYFDAQVVMHLAPELVLSPLPRKSEPAEQPGFFAQNPGAIALLSIAGVSLVAGGWFTYKYDERDTVADDARQQIVGALNQHVQAGVFGPSSVPCGPNGVASGAVTFDPSLSVASQESLVGDYANACAEFQERTQAADRNKTLALVSFGVSAVASAALLTWYFADSADGDPPEADRARGPRLTPVLTADSGGLLVDLEF